MDLKTILETGPFHFTLAEIEEILDYELNSPPETMDVDLIDLCVENLAAGLNLQI